jgi:hypothetical protein
MVYEVNHKNLIKSDNCPGNLQYVTRSFNLLHRTIEGPSPADAATSHPRRTSTPG